MVEAGSTQTEETPVKPIREFAFNMAIILRESSRPIGEIEHMEEMGRRFNPNGTKHHLTIEKVNKMMRGKHMP